MELKDLTEEQKARASKCKTPEDLVALAQEQGVDLSDKQLEEISGGEWNHKHCHDKSLSAQETRIADTACKTPALTAGLGELVDLEGDGTRTQPQCLNVLRLSMAEVIRAP